MSNNESKDENKVISIAGTRSKEKKSTKKTKQEKQDKQEQVDEPVYCSFCARPNHLVIKMIKGPGVNICSECIMVCIQYFMLEDRIPSSEAQKILNMFWQESKK